MPKSSPPRARGAQTRARLLDAAAALLSKGGLDRFNTNALAAQAGVTPPTVYRYFSSKIDVLLALAEELAAQELEWLGDLAGLADCAADLETELRAILGRYATGLQQYPAARPLRAAMKALPELREVEDRTLTEPAMKLGRALRARSQGNLSRRQARDIARIAVRVASQALDDSLIEPSRAQRKRDLEELTCMLAAYLERRLA